MLPMALIDFNDTDSDGNTPLHQAIERKVTEYAMHLIQSGCDVNKKNKDGDTPLMYAVDTNNVLVAYEILKKGANVNEQTPDGHTVLHFSCFTRNVVMLHLLMYYDADPGIKNIYGETLFMFSLKHFFPNERTVEFQRCAIDFEADMNETNTHGNSTLFLACIFETPLLEEIINRGADVNYVHYKGLNALQLSLRSRNSKAFNLIWPKFDYQQVYGSYLGRPLLSNFFINRLDNDWFHCYSTVSNSPIMEHAVKHYTFDSSLPPLISQVVKQFGKHRLSETTLFPYVCVLLSYGARVFLSDIEMVFTCYGDSTRTLNFLYDMDVELEKARPYYISHPYIMLKVNRDVDTIFNNYMFRGWFVSWHYQLMFLPILFKFCTPTHRFISRFFLFSDWLHREYRDFVVVDNGYDSVQAVITGYRNLKVQLMANIGFVPSLIELSRNATRKAICLQYNIKGYSEYRRFLRNFGLPLPIVKMLLFRTPLKNRIIMYPR